MHGAPGETLESPLLFRGPRLRGIRCDHNYQVERRTLEPEDFAIHRATADDLKGGDKERNLAIATEVLSGERGPQRDIVLVNAAAALVAAGKVDTFLEGMAIGTVSIDSGAARRKVAELAEFTAG
jgi:anthranilate phosphoribosyltransferase